jgi:hypothetical protein
MTLRVLHEYAKAVWQCLGINPRHRQLSYSMSDRKMPFCRSVWLRHIRQGKESAVHVGRPPAPPIHQIKSADGDFIRSSSFLRQAYGQTFGTLKTPDVRTVQLRCIEEKKGIGRALG